MTSRGPEQIEFRFAGVVATVHLGSRPVARNDVLLVLRLFFGERFGHWSFQGFGVGAYTSIRLFLFLGGLGGRRQLRARTFEGSVGQGKCILSNLSSASGPRLPSRPPHYAMLCVDAILFNQISLGPLQSAHTPQGNMREHVFTKYRYNDACAGSRKA